MTITQSLARNYLFIAGLVLIVLGVGNAVAALTKVHEYRAVLTATTPQVEAATALVFRGAQRYVPSEARERWEIAQAKLDFYHVVLTSGRLMFGLGIACTALGLIRLRRRLSRTHPSQARETGASALQGRRTGDIT